MGDVISNVLIPAIAMMLFILLFRKIAKYIFKLIMWIVGAPIRALLSSMILILMIVGAIIYFIPKEIVGNLQSLLF